jgi:methyl-accepting chemotaxis protein PixJ
MTNNKQNPDHQAPGHSDDNLPTGFLNMMDDMSALDRSSLSTDSSTLSSVLSASNLPADDPVITLPRAHEQQSFSLKTKAAIFATLMAIVPAALVGALSVWQTNSFTNQQVKAGQQERATAIADKLNRFIFERFGDVEIMAALPIFTDVKVAASMTKEQKSALLNKYRDTYLVYDNMAAFDLQGNVMVQSTGATLVNPTNSDYFKQVMADGKTYMSKPELAKDTNQLVVYFVTPIKDGSSGKVLGMMRTRAPIDRLEVPIKDFATPSEAYHLIDSRTNQFFLSSNKDYIGKPANKDIETAMAKGATEHTNTQSNKAEVLATAPFGKLPGMPQLPWTAASTIDASVAYQQRQDILLVLLIGAGLTSIAAALVASSLAGKAVNPLIETTEAVARIGQGDFSQRVNEERNDELGVLATNINSMTGQIEDLLLSQANALHETQVLGKIAQARTEGQLTEPLNEILKETRNLIQADRLVVYRFYPNWGGHVVAESVGAGHVSAMGERITDGCIPQILRDQYVQGRVVSHRNVLEAGYHADHVKLFDRLNIKSSLVVPIVQGDSLIALLVAHHCQDYHDWTVAESDLLLRVAVKLSAPMSGFAIAERNKFSGDRDRSENENRQRELIRLLGEIEGAATGDLTVRSEISEGEIAIVGDFFNSIIENIRDIVTTVKSSTLQVGNYMGENEAEIRQLATAATAQAEQINLTLKKVEAGTISIREVANNAKQAAVVATSATATAQQGGKAIDNTVTNINQLRDTVAETAKKVKRLGESSQQISKAISLINQIALQTNLLAINASIEAARAGEEGRGFAVVAEEVAQLATQSAAATKEIEKIVETIQRETSEVTQAMELSTTQVVEGTRSVEQTKLSLKEIIDQSQQIDVFLQSIATAAIEQAESSQAITQVMTYVAQVSNQTSTSSEQVSNSLQATGVITRELQSIVGQFKVNADNN